jgi:hypothetical protein
MFPKHVFRGHFSSRPEKNPIRIKTLEGIYSLKRLSGEIVVLL